MMQHIATTSTKLAVIGTQEHSSSSRDSQNPDYFRQMLEENNRHYAQPVKPVTAPEQSRRMHDDKQAGKAEPVPEPSRADSQERVEEPRQNTTSRHAESSDGTSERKQQDVSSDKDAEHASSIENEDKNASEQDSATEQESQSEQEEPASEVSAGAENTEAADANKDGESVDGTTQENDDVLNDVASNLEETINAQQDIDWLALLQQAQQRAASLSEEGGSKTNTDELSNEESESDANDVFLANLAASFAEEGTEESVEGDSDIGDMLDKLLGLVEQLGKQDTSTDFDVDVEEQMETLTSLIERLREQLADDSNGNGEANADEPDAALIAALLAAQLRHSDTASEARKPEDTAVEGTFGEKGIDLSFLTTLSDKEQTHILTKLVDNIEASVKQGENTVDVAAKELNLISQLSKQDKQHFVDALKAMLKDAKSSGADVTSQTITNAMTSALQTIQPNMAEDVIAEQSAQLAASLMRASEAATLVARQLESHHATQQTPLNTLNTVDKVATKEAVVTSQIEQAKQQAQQTDKPVNILKPEGQQQLVEKVRFMVNQNNMQADIRLDPPELGSMKIRINMSGEAASVNFVVQSQAAREAIEHNTPRLKELLEEQGIELGQSSVEQESQSSDDDTELAGGSNGDGASDEENNEMVTEQPVTRGRVGGIDYFV
ncbi:flagellar hook-length control protein FliK [Aestuariibacter sp. AA17]|uniref:Flagellar hook-length control protein FliK n=1 Tax=Fluctibacter corallii TaxID=2984329 RepID=A0ABT3A9Q7_9ALTE|nr:flagellar hook-length control protein FliK [Aestuariibacter sp. AA17]MCV2885417.1 flagellar hook-length control protein FliK [Aestuariibacter sp. AA17]